MRTPRTLTLGLMTVALMVGAISGASAQSPAADAMASTYVTGTLGAGDGDPTPGDRSDQNGIIETRGSTMSGLDVASSDPRLGGAYSYTGNSDEYPGGVRAQAGSVVIRDDLGAWLGTSTEFVADEDIETVQLAGEGAYAGLTAYLVVDWGKPTRPFQGIIFAGEMPEPPTAE